MKKSRRWKKRKAKRAKKLTLDTPEPWARLRRDTPGAERVAHFNNAGAALSPRPVIEAVKAHLDLEAEIGGYEAARARRDELANVYRDVGAVIGANPDNIALTANATDAYARALSSIPFERGDVVIAAWAEYASNQIQLLSLAERFGVEIVRAPKCETGGADLGALEKLIKDRRPKLVATVHVNTSSGAIEDVAAIGAVCRREDVLYLVDGCQSLGQMPIDVNAIGCDFFSATSRKFLRGPRGAGLLYVSDRVLDQGLQPLFIDLKGAMLLDEKRYRAQKGARRFEDWEFSYAVLFGFGAAARYALDIGLARIAERLGEINRFLRSEIEKRDGWRVVDSGRELCPIIPVHAEGADGEQVHRALSEAGVNTALIPKAWAPMDEGLSKAGWVVRISPHYYNARPDFDRLLNGLETALRR